MNVAFMAKRSFRVAIKVEIEEFSEIFQAKQNLMFKHQLHGLIWHTGQKNIQDCQTRRNKQKNKEETTRNKKGRRNKKNNKKCKETIRNPKKQ